MAGGGVEGHLADARNGCNGVEWGLERRFVLSVASRLSPYRRLSALGEMLGISLRFLDGMFQCPRVMP
jgi:hypothetical protein